MNNMQALAMHSVQLPIHHFRGKEIYWWWLEARALRSSARTVGQRVRAAGNMASLIIAAVLSVALADGSQTRIPRWRAHVERALLGIECCSKFLMWSGNAWVVIPPSRCWITASRTIAICVDWLCIDHHGVRKRWRHHLWVPTTYIYGSFLDHIISA